MIKVHAKMQSGDILIECKGHADYAPHGQDIVCAAVSVIMQTALLGLESLAATYPNHVEIIDIEEGPTT